MDPLARARELILAETYAIVLGPAWEEVNRLAIVTILEREGVADAAAIAEQALLDLGGHVERTPKSFAPDEDWVRWIKPVDPNREPG